MHEHLQAVYDAIVIGCGPAGSAAAAVLLALWPPGWVGQSVCP